MSLLLSGSCAYDYIMNFDGHFENHILEGHVHTLNVCFVVDELHKHFGGTAGNIAYTMKLLGDDPLVLGMLGKDGQPYLDHFTSHGINTSHIHTSATLFTASAHITTDAKNNQITAFYNGALQEAYTHALPKETTPYTFVLLSPNQKDAMIRHAQECRALHIPYCFDPGQQITAFSSDELRDMIDHAACYIVNDYELSLTEQKTGYTKADLASKVQTLIVTLGEQGSEITTADALYTIPPCPIADVVDPTGAGDAYRAGFFVGYMRHYDMDICGRMGSVAAAYAIEQAGTQCHTFSFAEFEKRYYTTYGTHMPSLV